VSERQRWDMIREVLPEEGSPKGLLFLPTQDTVTVTLGRTDRQAELDEGVRQAVRTILHYLGANPRENPSLEQTPERVRRALLELTQGTEEAPGEILSRTFSEACDEMVLVRGIRFTSLCEHHLLPFVGTATVGYLPDGRIVGLSKLPRLVQCFARRLQVQERLTAQITQALMEHLKPKGAAAIVEASHMCLACRGALQPEATMVTSSLLGAFQDDARTRQEFLDLARRRD
jgi:GTP cyclohydrolase IA